MIFLSPINLADATTLPFQQNVWVAEGHNIYGVPTSGTAIIHDGWAYQPYQVAMGQTGGTALYFRLIQNSTLDTESLIEPFVSSVLKSKIERLFRSAKRQVFVDGVESNFSRELISLVEANGPSVVEAISALIGTGKVSDDVVAEALRWMGLMDDDKSLIERRDLLEECLSSDSSTIRDGAIIGLSYLADPHSIGVLRRALKKEKSAMLLEYMQEVLLELQGVE